MQARDRLPKSEHDIDDPDKKGLPNPQHADIIQSQAQMLNRLLWYHGLMPRDEIEDLLKKDGDFLARKTDVGTKERLVISIKWQNRVRHVLVKLTSDSRFNITDQLSFTGVEDMVCFFVGARAELFPDGTKLLHPIRRPEWYLLHDNIVIKKKVGSGSFGDVFVAELAEKDRKIEVAVKMLKGKLGKKDRAGFVKEASINRRFKHPNIVRLLGVAAQVDPIMVVLELAPNGSLRGHLRDHPELLIDQLNKFLWDAAKGLEYLSMMEVIHRDIAARNCLLGADMTVKISDFGLSVSISDLKESKLGKVPIKWLAPETLSKAAFSTKTDVFTFGVMMWEVYVRCKTDPYPGMTNAEARVAIQGGRTMDPPPDTPPAAQQLMRECFRQNPDERPTFSLIAQRLQSLCHA